MHLAFIVVSWVCHLTMYCLCFLPYFGKLFWSLTLVVLLEACKLYFFVFWGIYFSTLKGSKCLSYWDNISVCAFEVSYFFSCNAILIINYWPKEINYSIRLTGLRYLLCTHMLMVSVTIVLSRLVSCNLIAISSASLPPPN